MPQRDADFFDLQLVELGNRRSARAHELKALFFLVYIALHVKLQVLDERDYLLFLAVNRLFRLELDFLDALEMLFVVEM